MSSSLYWKPPEPEGRTLGTALKFALRDYFGGYFSEWQTVGERDVGFLRGLVAGTDDKTLAKDAQFLIEKIDKYGYVEVKESY